MSKHTQGPWFVGMRSGHNANMIFVRNGDEQFSDQGIAQIYGLPLNRSIDEIDECEGLANARLIAAAPELLEALLVARQALYSLPLMDQRLVQIRAAIDKATG